MFNVTQTCFSRLTQTLVIWTLDVMGHWSAVNWKSEQQAVVNQRQCCDWKWFKAHSLYEFIVWAVCSYRKKPCHSDERRIRRATGTSIRRTLLQQWPISASELCVLKKSAVLFRLADVRLKLFCLHDHLLCFCSSANWQKLARAWFSHVRIAEIWDLCSPGRASASSERLFLFFF